jgi:TolA-binding protein
LASSSIYQQEEKPKLDHKKEIITKIEQQLEQQLNHLGREIKNIELQLKDLDLEQEQQQREQREQQKERLKQSKEKEQLEQKQKQQSTFYIVKRRVVGNLWEAISYFDENNNFRGLACFDTLKEAEDYQRKFEDKLILKHLKRFGVNNNNNGSNDKAVRVVTHYNSEKTLRIFCEHSLPTIKRSGLYR